MSIDTRTIYPEMGFHSGDLVEIRQDLKEELVFYRGIFSGITPEWLKVEKKKFEAKDGFMLYVGCATNENGRMPRMVLHFLYKETVWHTFFWNAYGVSLNLVKVRMK